MHTWPQRASRPPCWACCWAIACCSMAFSMSPDRDCSCLLTFRGSLIPIGLRGACQRGFATPRFFLCGPKLLSLRLKGAPGASFGSCGLCPSISPPITAPRGPGRIHWLGVRVSGTPSAVVSWLATWPAPGGDAWFGPPPWGSGGSMVIFRGLEASRSRLTR